MDDNFNLVRREVINVPIIGKVAAGEPIFAVENMEGYFPIPAEYMPKGKTTFMLEVKGESMVNAGILSGDKVLVQQQATAENGEMIVALVEDSATVKTYYKRTVTIVFSRERCDGSHYCGGRSADLRKSHRSLPFSGIAALNGIRVLLSTRREVHKRRYCLHKIIM